MTIDKYEVLAPIGTGGMGRVYRARMKGPGGASKQVALKVMHSHLAEDESFVLMFLDEMRVAMALGHRNIVQTFDAGQAGDDYYLVMELIEGYSTRQLLARLAEGEQLPLDIALFVAMEVSAALDYAHRFRPEGSRRAGVLHRDISPSNILLSFEGDVKLADFGVAKAAGGRYVTSANVVRGRLQYMAPEQARGQAGPSSDLFSLGAVIYEMATGEAVPRPSAFEGLQHTTLPPSPQVARPELSPAFAELILRCLEPEPAARPGSAGELRQVLTKVAQDLRLPPGANADPHARLRHFLADHRPSAPSEAAGPAPQVGRLAQAVLQQVRAVETDPDFCGNARQVIRPPGVSPLSPQPETQPADPRSVADAARPTGRGAVVALSGLALVLIVSGALWLAGRSDTIQVRQTPPAVVATGKTTTPLDRDGRDEAVPRADVTVVSLSTARAEPSEKGQDARRDDDGRVPPPVVPTEAPRARDRSRRAAHYGYLDINSLPWAKVYIDGRLRGETPLQRLRLPAGRHTVRLVSTRNGADRTFSVRVVAGGTVSRVFNLTPGRSSR